MSKKIFALFFALMVFGTAYAVSETYEAQASDEPAMEAQAEKTSSVSGIKYLAAAAAVGIGQVFGGVKL